VTPAYLTRTEPGRKKARLVKDPDFRLIYERAKQRLEKWAVTCGVEVGLNDLSREADLVKHTGEFSLHSERTYRYSRSQNQDEWLGGITGSLTFEKVPAEFLPLLKICEYLHIGKKTVHGQGKIRIEIKSQ